MKKVIIEGRVEEVEFVCDSCRKEAFGHLQLNFWYGSTMDMTQGSIHLCDSCAKNVLELLKSKLDLDIKLTEISEF
jgi:hypothetical protein